MVLLVKAITVTIVFDNKKAQCDGQCGLDWSSTEMVGIVKKHIKERFGDSVKLELVDLSVNNSRTATLKKRIENENLYLPLLLINDGIRIPGSFDIRQLSDAIEVEQEINGTTV